MRLSRHLPLLLAAALLSAGAAADAALVTAGTLFVDLDARHATAGTAAWANAGSLGGSFAEFGNPVVSNLGPNANPAVTFDGTNDFYRGPAAPIGLTGAGAAGTRSVEVWVLNPAIANEETLVSLAKRGGPSGSNISFNYGSNAGFGAVGHWAGADIGWNGAPAAGQWQHLVYTFDGTTTSVYANGVLKASENSTTANGGVPLDAHDAVFMQIAAQMEADGVTATAAGLRGSLSIGNVRVHDGVLAAADVKTNFLNDSNRFGATAFASTPVHRYSFDGVGGNGAVLTDSIGGAHGVLRAADGSALTGAGQMNLGGGSSATAGYGDLPNGIVSSLTNATFEAWVTWETNGNWSRIFDFGDSTAGEVLAPGGGFSGNGGGADGYLFLTPGTDTGGNLRVGLYEPGPGEVFATGPGRLPLGSQQHVAVVFDDANDLMSLYHNGNLVASVNVAGRSLSQVFDVNNWLGRSNFSGDSNFDGLFDEFRIYDSALTGQQILGNFLTGPDSLNAAIPVPEPATVLLGVLGVGALALRRRRRA